MTKLEIAALVDVVKDMLVDGYVTIGAHRPALEKALAAIQSQPDAAAGWQPIETAPADCLLLLAYEFDRIGDWRIKVGGFWNGEWEVFGASWTPTRWLPMVAAPTVSDYEARRAAIRAIQAQGSDAA